MTEDEFQTAVKAILADSGKADWTFDDFYVASLAVMGRVHADLQLRYQAEELRTGIFMPCLAHDEISALPWTKAEYRVVHNCAGTVTDERTRTVHVCRCPCHTVH